MKKASCLFIYFAFNINNFWFSVDFLKLYLEFCVVSKEAEVVVDSFEEMDTILSKIGLKARNYQENKRHQFKYKNTEIDVDSWPLIPAYMEIEGSNEQAIKEVCCDLGLEFNSATTMDVTDIYKNVYNIDILKIKELKLKK